MSARQPQPALHPGTDEAHQRAILQVASEQGKEIPLFICLTTGQKDTFPRAISATTTKSSRSVANKSLDCVPFEVSLSEAEEISVCALMSRVFALSGISF